MDKNRIREVYTHAEQHMKSCNIGCFKGMDKPIFMISNTYPGVWLEHLYDSVFYSKLYPGEDYCMKNIIELYIDYQTDDGQLPFVILNRAFYPDRESIVGYSQIQECVSFGSLCLEAYRILGDVEFLKKCYGATIAWISWLENNRMTRGTGLVEMFCGCDTGHDGSARFRGISCPGHIMIDGVKQHASVLPPEDGVSPITALDMNCNYYGNLASASEMAHELGLHAESEYFAEKARYVKSRIFELCFDKDDCFFYDADKNGNLRKVKSSTLFHLFLEKVLDRDEDAELIAEIYSRHIKNPDEFWTEYPLPSVAYNDPATNGHSAQNCWGYFCQMLIYLRCTLWMDYYGFEKDFDYILAKIVEVWTDNFDRVKFAQEFDPVTGEPTKCSEWYSSCMLIYIYAVRRLGLL